MEYDKKTNNELIVIMNQLSEEQTKIQKDVEDLLKVYDDIDMRYLYIQELIKKRMKK